ncbi:hypothetical protein CDAR_6971 [Caerostris darwini]|uniref:Uncharacterized protein n=1 Tax=Caerostris darwini TaxID=1538125 RepID=A0AAV4PI47_9ARAC|nr:hypothetical protein CDAR_6971 [Caerostris darwini]
MTCFGSQAISSPGWKTMALSTSKRDSSARAKDKYLRFPSEEATAQATGVCVWRISLSPVTAAIPRSCALANVAVRK